MAARILYVWEFGGGLGHLVPAISLANAYRARGYEVGFVVKDIAAASSVISSETFSIYQAPVWFRGSTPVRHPISYAEILLNHGMGDARALTNLITAWLRLFELLQPDLIIADFSPTAAMAAQISKRPHCAIGHGFFVPPRLTPVPAYIEGTDRARLCRSETVLLESINQARVAIGHSRLSCLADVFDAQFDLLTTWPEIEHYPQRQPPAQYWGPILRRMGINAPAWREGSISRVFVYLYGKYPNLHLVLQALQVSSVDALIYCPGMPASMGQRFASERLRFSKNIYALDQVLGEADALICHGNFGTVWESLLSGTPLLCFPVHMEQWITTQRLVALGAAIQIEKELSTESIKNALFRLLEQPTHEAAAQHVASRYRHHSPSIQLNALVDESTKGI